MRLLLVVCLMAVLCDAKGYFDDDVEDIEELPKSDELINENEKSLKKDPLFFSSRRRFSTSRRRFSSTRRRFISTRRRFSSTRRRFISTRRRFISTRRRFISTRRRFISTRRRFISTRRRFISTRRRFISTRRRFSSTRRRFISTRRRFISTRRRFISTRRRFISTRRRFISTRRRVISTRRRFISTRRRFISIRRRVINTRRRLVGSRRRFVVTRRRVISTRRRFISTRRRFISIRRRVINTRRRLVGSRRRFVATRRRTIRKKNLRSKYSLTWKAEGNNSPSSPYFSRKPHVPSGSSGLTIGRGYDMKKKSKSQVLRELKSAGVPTDQAEKLSGGAGLKGNKAKIYLQKNLKSLVITERAQEKLFGISVSEKVSTAKRIFTKTDVVKKYGKANWDTLNPAIKNLVVDLLYRGDYKPSTRKFLQKPIVDNDVKKLSEIMGDKKLWEDKYGVPPDRFNRRKEYLKNTGN